MSVMVWYVLGQEGNELQERIKVFTIRFFHQKLNLDLRYLQNDAQQSGAGECRPAYRKNCDFDWKRAM